MLNFPIQIPGRGANFQAPGAPVAAISSPFVIGLKTSPSAPVAVISSPFVIGLKTSPGAPVAAISSPFVTRSLGLTPSPEEDQAWKKSRLALAAGAIPTWDMFFNKFQAYHRAQYGIGIDRPWTADADASRAKLSIDKEYIDNLTKYNIAHNTAFVPDKTVLGVNAQTTGYTPKNNGGGFFGDAFSLLTSGVKDLMPPADVVKAAIVIGTAGYGAATIGNTVAGAASTGVSATQLPFVPDLSAPVMSADYVAPAIATAAPVSFTQTAAVLENPFVSATQLPFVPDLSAPIMSADYVAPAIAYPSQGMVAAGTVTEALTAAGKAISTVSAISKALSPAAPAKVAVTALNPLPPSNFLPILLGLGLLAKLTIFS